MSYVKMVLRMGILACSLLLLSTCNLYDRLVGAVDHMTGLVAYYRFDGNANDETRHGNDGTVHGATLVEDRHGRRDSAYSFDGIDDYIDAGDAEMLNPTEAVSIAAWVYVRSFPTTWPPIVKKNGSGANEYTGYSLECYDSGPQAVFSVCLEGPLVGQSQGVAFSPGDWHFVVGVYDGEACRMYLDGVPSEPQPYTGQVIPSSNHLFIGRDPFNTTRYFDGVIDDVCIFDRTLQFFEIEALYHR
jgi:hypothetical protein